MDNIARVASDLSEVSELATAQARRVEDLVAETVARVEDVRAQLALAATRPMDSVRDLGAVVKGAPPRHPGLPAARRARRPAARRDPPLRGRRTPVHLSGGPLRRGPEPRGPPT